MMGLWQDIRFGLRELRRDLFVTGLAVISLALAISGNTVVFGLVNGLLFRPLPYPQADQIVLIGEKERNQATSVTSAVANLIDWRDRQRSFVDLAGFRPVPMSFGASDRPEPVFAAHVSSGFFEILGVEPLLGRPLRAEDDSAGAENVVVLGFDFLKDRFDAGIDPVGQSLVLNREPYTIVGVLPEGFEFFNPQVKLWIPLVLDRAGASRDARDTVVVGRLGPGVTMDQARSEMDSIHAQLAVEYPESNRGFVLDTLNLRNDIPDSNGRVLFGLLQGAMIFVLLIACVNIANLLLARAQERRREIALRSALGAGRLRIVRQLVSETAGLTVLGGALGLFLGAIGLRYVAHTFAGAIPSYWSPVIDIRVVAATAGLTALAGLLFGLSPAWMSFQVNLVDAVKEGGRGSSGGSRRWLSRGLVVAEIALSLMLLAGGSVLVESFVALRNADPGFDESRLLTVSLSLPNDETLEPSGLVDRLIQRAESLPGVKRATLTSALPQNAFVTTTSFEIEGRSPAPDEALPRAVQIITTPEYLDTLEFPLAQGRFLDASDRKDTGQVVVVSQSVAERHFADGDALGRVIKIQETERRVVGVVGNIQQSIVNQGESSQGVLYVPYPQQPFEAGFLLLNCDTDPDALVGTVRNELLQVDAQVSIGQIQTLKDFVNQFFVGADVFNAILTGFGALALLLAVVGTYGVLAYYVAHRAQEFGIRIALGARPASLVRTVARQGAMMAILGLAVGAPGVILIARVISGIIVYAPPVSPTTILASFLILFIATLAASWLPARRAATADPIRALKAE